MTKSIELPNKAYMLPDSIPDWPPVWWFWLVIAGALLALILLLLGMYHHYRKHTYRREALQQLKQHTGLSDLALIELCLTLMKRCLITEGKEALASLTNKELLPELDRQLRSSRVKLVDYEEYFVTLIYQPHTQLTATQRQAIIQITSTWIRRHRA